MKKPLVILKRKLKEFSPSNLLSGGLLGLLLIIYIYTIYAIVITLGTFPFGKQPPSSFLPTSEHWLLNLIVLLCLALTIIPVSRWLRNRVNDLVYTQDDNLYALPVTINQQLREMSNLQFTMPRVVETIGTTLRLPYVVIEIGSEAEQRYSFGSPSDQIAVHEIPIHYLNDRLGTLLVSNKSLSDDVHNVLQECAQQIGVALYVAQLTDVIQTSREQIVIAREEERRRIRNDLHDGLAPTLSSFQLQLGAIRKLMSNNPVEAEKILQELSQDLKQATKEIRELVYDLRPPKLDEMGLVEAIKNLGLVNSNLQLELNVPNSFPALSAALEVAIFRIATEAIHNIVKHANATTCTVHISDDSDVLSLEIIDNGKGMPADYANGIGLQSMRERAAELGGTFSIQPVNPYGTQIVVHLPWRETNG